ncbi:MAG: hypothetical protein AABY65_09785 [Nitrospirota bacterium]
MATLVRKQVSGFEQPRWMKPKCVRYLEVGAIPTIFGVWIPDFVGQYALKVSGQESAAMPPLITYAGALILWAGCAHAIEKMGVQYKRMMVSGAAAVVLALMSVFLHFGVVPGDKLMLALFFLSIGLCAYAATFMFYFTIAKAAELGMESRMTRIRDMVFWTNNVALFVGALSIGAILLSSPSWVPLMRGSVLLFTVAWLFCRLAVYYFKTDKSLGVFFAKPPSEQFWV